MLRATLSSGRSPSSAEPGSNPSSSAVDTTIASLIERATYTTAPSVDPALLRAIQSSARAPDGAIRDALRLLLSLMSKPHSHVCKPLLFSLLPEFFTLIPNYPNPRSLMR